MTSSDLPGGLPSITGDLEAIAEETFTRPDAYRQIELEALRDIAAHIFYERKKWVDKLQSQVDELRKLAEMIAIVIGKTYVERGDSFSLADDEALTLIRDLLLSHSPTIVVRNKKKRIPRRLFL